MVSLNTGFYSITWLIVFQHWFTSINFLSIYISVILIFIFGSSVFRQVIGLPMGTNSAPLLADLFLHTFEYDFMVKTMKQDITEAIQFSNTFRYIDDLFSVNNVDFGNYISAIYPSEFKLKDTSKSSTEVCYPDTNIKTGDINKPFRINVCDIREMTLHFGLSTLLIWKAATFPPIQVTVFIYLSWWDMPEFARPKLTSEIDPADFHYVNKALKPIYFRNHLTNSSIAMVLSSRSMVQPWGRWD